MQSLPSGLAFVTSAEDASHLASTSSKGTLFSRLYDASITCKNTKHIRKVAIKNKDGRTQTLQLVADGDFNGDGTRDILLYVSRHILEAHFQQEGLQILTSTERGGYRMRKKIPSHGL